jgi:ornithine--oxo-acid transaminase
MNLCCCQLFLVLLYYYPNDLLCLQAVESLKVLIEEEMGENSERQGAKLRRELTGLASPLVKVVRGKGLMIAIEINEDAVKAKSKDGLAWDVCLKMADKGTH